MLCRVRRLNEIKIINDIFVRLLKSTKLKPSNPYKVDVVVFVSVKIDNLKAVSKFKLSKSYCRNNNSYFFITIVGLDYY